MKKRIIFVGLKIGESAIIVGIAHLIALLGKTFNNWSHNVMNWIPDNYQLDTISGFAWAFFDGICVIIMILLIFVLIFLLIFGIYHLIKLNWKWASKFVIIFAILLMTGQAGAVDFHCEAKRILAGMKTHVDCPETRARHIAIARYLAKTYPIDAEDSEIVTSHPVWTEPFFYICSEKPRPKKKCGWEYKYIDAGEKIPEGWEPFGVTTTFDYDQKGIAEYRLWANRHIIWLKKRVCEEVKE